MDGADTEEFGHLRDSPPFRDPTQAVRLPVGVEQLAPAGWLVSRTPSTDGRGAFQDPTHVSFWNPNSFWYYTRREQANYVRGIDCRFQAPRLWQSYPSKWHEEKRILYVFADLVALKGQRQPGICTI